MSRLELVIQLDPKRAAILLDAVLGVLFDTQVEKDLVKQIVYTRREVHTVFDDSSPSAMSGSRSGNSSSACRGCAAKNALSSTSNNSFVYLSTMVLALGVELVWGRVIALLS